MARVRDLWHGARTGRRTVRYGTGRRWLAEWKVDGRARTRTFDRKLDAERHLAVTVTSQLSGAYVDPASGRITVAAYAERWLAEQPQLRAGSRERYRSHLDCHILPALGKAPLGDVRRTAVQSLVSALAAGELAPGSVRSVARTMQILFRAAVSDQLIARTPCEKLRLPDPTDSKATPLTVDQVAALAAAVPDRYAALVLLAAHTGLRTGELFGLEVDPRRGVDFLRRRILVRQQLLTHPGRPPFLGPPKTKASRRDVPIGQRTAELLAEHLEAWPVEEVELVDETGPKPVTRPARLAFLSPSGRPIRRSGFADTWRAACDVADDHLLGGARKAAGRPLRAEEAAAVVLPERTVPHSLRHTYVSLLIARGAHPKTIQVRVGHKSITETMDTYGHLFPDQDDITRDAIDAAFAGLGEAVEAVRTEQERNGGGGQGP